MGKIMITEDEIIFDEKGLIPAIIQDIETKEILMMAYMNREALELTMSTGFTHFWSRSRNKLWKKGETSGHYQHVIKIFTDCDKDALVIQVKQDGVACHTGNYSCFYNLMIDSGDEKKIHDKLDEEEYYRMIDKLYQIILDRKRHPKEGSYVSSLISRGDIQVLKKIGEEAIEVIAASLGENEERVINEIADLWFHTLVLMGLKDLGPEKIFKELYSRHLRRTSESKLG